MNFIISESNLSLQLLIKNKVLDIIAFKIISLIYFIKS